MATQIKNGIDGFSTLVKRLIPKDTHFSVGVEKHGRCRYNYKVNVDIYNWSIESDTLEGAIIATKEAFKNHL